MTGCFQPTASNIRSARCSCHTQASPCAAMLAFACILGPLGQLWPSKNPPAARDLSTAYTAEEEEGEREREKTNEERSCCCCSCNAKSRPATNRMLCRIAAAACYLLLAAAAAARRRLCQLIPPPHSRIRPFHSNSFFHSGRMQRGCRLRGRRRRRRCSSSEHVVHFETISSNHSSIERAFASL